ncbi:MAG: DUF421 domain-containing protein [Oscillospiraceae bacterium]|nr:DUF421 domain-containing protein [Oscillospiraceae bacterium]
MLIIFARTLIIFASILFFMRLLGKRQLRELELSELVVSVLIADVAATPLQDIGIPLLNGLIPIVTLFACELIISGGILSSVHFRSIMCGKPEFLIIDGKIQEKEMRKAKFSVDELFEELRSMGILEIKTVKYAILETDGSLSTFLFPEYKPVSVREIKVKPEEENYPVILIEDGVLLNANLAHIDKNKSWLSNEISMRGCKRIKDVFAMIYYSDKDIYFMKKYEL